MGSVISESGRAEFRRCLAGRSNLSFGWKEADSSAALRNGSQKSKSKARSELLFRFGGISWIIDEDERVPDRLAIPFQFRNTGCRDLNPASRRVRWGRSTSSAETSCLPAEVAGHTRKEVIMREIITLQCPDCKNRNYSTTKNKKTTTGRLEFSKFCNTCRKHTAHKETK